MFCVNLRCRLMAANQRRLNIEASLRKHVQLRQNSSKTILWCLQARKFFNLPSSKLQSQKPKNPNCFVSQNCVNTNSNVLWSQTKKTACNLPFLHVDNSFCRLSESSWQKKILNLMNYWKAFLCGKERKRQGEIEAEWFNRSTAVVAFFIA